MSKQHTRAEMATEIKVELTMRKRVWKNTTDRNTGKPFFSTQSHQSRYDIMSQVLDLLEGITDVELQKLCANIERRKEEGKSQTKLFADEIPCDACSIGVVCSKHTDLSNQS